MRLSRYSRQLLLPEIGPRGQRKLAGARVTVIGCGALGTHSLSLLVRAGVGHVTVVDRDVVDLSNLQRQMLFCEEDVGRPKAKVAVELLGRVNSGVDVKGIVKDLNHTNAERLIDGSSVVVDATDNMETRFLVNDACTKLGIPWVYGGAVGVSGMVMVVSKGGPCLRCVFPNLPGPGELATCDTAGIVNTLPGVVAAIQVTEAFKLIMGKEHAHELMVIDAWSHDLEKVKVRRNPECQCCGKRDFEFLTAKRRKLVTSLCGRDAVQIVHSKPTKADLRSLERRLGKLGSVTLRDDVLIFRAKDAELTVFPDGRTVVHGTTDPSKAKTVFSRYIGD